VNQKRHRLWRNDKTCDFIEAETHSLLAFIVVLSRLGSGVELRNRVFLRFLASPSIDEVSGFANNLPPTHQSTFLCSSVSLSLFEHLQETTAKFLLIVQPQRILANYSPTD
jgi:hypothetical protein